MEDLRNISVFDGDDAEEMTAEEKKEFYRANEQDILRGLLEALDYKNDDENTAEIIIQRKDKEYFRFRIRPLTEDESVRIRDKHTKMIKNKATGAKVRGDINAVEYRSDLIYTATVAEDRKKIWDNKQVQQKAGVFRGFDLVDALLLAGEKDRIIDEIDRLSGFEDNNLEEIAKN